MQVTTERDINLFTGEEFVRVTYRDEGVRWWTRIAVFPDYGQSLDEVEELAGEIAAFHLAGKENP